MFRHVSFCLSTWGATYPARQGIPPFSLTGGTPSSIMGVPHPAHRRGTPIQPDREDTLWYPPYPEIWVPPPGDRTAQRVLTTQRVVCLLCSRRRTFSFQLKLGDRDCIIFVVFEHLRRNFSTIISAVWQHFWFWDDELASLSSNLHSHTSVLNVHFVDNINVLYCILNPDTHVVKITPM